MSNDNVTSKRTLSDTEYTKVQGALQTLIGIVGAAEFTQEGHAARVLPPFEKCNLEEYEVALVRTVLAIRAHRTAQERNVLIAAKSKIDAAMHVVRLARVEAYREIASLSPAVKALLGEEKCAAPTATSLPVSEVVGFFPEGTTQEQAIALLHKMNYKLVAGAKRDDVKKLVVHIGADFLTKQLAAKGDVKEETTSEEK